MWRILVWLKRYLGEQLWLKPALASAGAVFLAIVGLWFGQLYSGPLPIELSDRALKDLLSIFASSMLAAATFSVSSVVTAVSSVSNSTTPRASRLILSDPTTQNVLSSFIAAFIYSVIGILALEAFTFDAVGRFVVFVGIAAIMTWVLVAFVHWIHHVTRLGRVETAIEKITDTASESLIPDNVGQWGAHCYDGSVPAAAVAITSSQVGYVTNIYVAGMQKLAEELDVAIYVRVRPGDFVDSRTPIAYASPVSDRVRERADEVQGLVAIAPKRVFGPDVRFAFLNLAETADRALSPGINDPGTAIVILGHQLRAITQWRQVHDEPETNEVRFDRVYLPPLKATELVGDCFTPIARDGAGVVEVGVRLQKTLGALVRLDMPELTEAAVKMSQTSLVLAENALVAEVHKESVRDAANEVLRLVNAMSDADRNYSAGDDVNF